MRKVVALLAVVVTSSAYGGVVTFSPAEVTIDLPVLTTGALDVGVHQGALGPIQTVDLYIGSSSVNLTGFTFDPAFVSATAFRSGPLLDTLQPIYSQSLYIGGFLNAPVASFDPIGRMTIDAAGLPVGDYVLGVNSVTDQQRSAFGMPDGETIDNSLIGSAIVHVVPEPATLSLLGLGLLGFLRRRFAA